MQNIRSVIDLLRQNPHRWSPRISSAYGVDLDSRILDKILYVSKSYMPLQLLQSVLSPFLCRGDRDPLITWSWWICWSKIW